MAIYVNGYGVKQDYAQAKYWHERAANQGDVDSQYILGSFYANGHGVPKNYQLAKVWFKKACDNGNQGGCDEYQYLDTELTD